MTQEKQNYREAKEFKRRILNRGFEGMEIFNGTNEENDKLIYDCYESDGGKNFSVGPYQGSVIFDTDRDGAYHNEDLDPANSVDQGELGLLARSNKA